MKKIIFMTSLVISAAALASSEVEAGHHAIEIPLKEIGWQAANLGILLIVLFFLVKDSIRQAFANRKKQFIEQSEKTKSALKNAEHALADIKGKLSTLESGEKSALEKASQESAALRVSMIKESEAQALKLKEDSALGLNVELEKAKMEVSAVIFDGAVTATTKKIADQKTQFTKDSESAFLRQVGQVKA